MDIIKNLDLYDKQVQLIKNGYYLFSNRLDTEGKRQAFLNIYRRKNLTKENIIIKY